MSSAGRSTSQPPRLPRLLQPVDTKLPSGPVRSIDISPYQNNPLHHYDQDVVRELSIPPQSVNLPTTPRSQTRQSNGFSLPTQPEGPQPSSYLTSPISNHVSLNANTSSLLTPSVHATQPSILAQHGLPFSLPPPPRTNFYSSSSLISPPEKSPEANNIAFLFDSLLTGSYSQMLSQKDTSVSTDSASAPPRAGESPRASSHDSSRTDACPPAPRLCLSPLPPIAEPEWSLDDMLQGDFIENNLEEYLTSPLIQDDSPEETPFLETPGEDVWTSPMVDESDDSFGLDQMPLFGAVVKQRPDEVKSATELLDVLGLYPAPETASPTFESSKMDSVTPVMDPLDSFNTMYTIPQTPAIHPASLYNSPRQPSTLPLAPSSHLSASSSAATSKPARSTKAMPTGTRRNITPSALVPLDAPTQPRQYVTPSVTSRKVVPSAFIKGKKRARSEVDGADDEVALEGDLDPNTSEAIEAKRRQNTLAARRSRQRKLQHVRELEDQVAQITQDRDMWMARAYDAEGKLRAHGIGA